jgi:hypothetical protein
MKKLDVFTWMTPAKKLSPDEVDRIMERLILSNAVDASQVPLHQPAEVEGTPELDLHRAILFDAVQCAVRHFHSPLAHQRQEAKAAVRWIDSNEESYFLSFVPICHRFHIDPEWIRRLVRERIRAGAREQVAEAA